VTPLPLLLWASVCILQVTVPLITASKLLLHGQLSLILNTALYFHLHVVWMQYLTEGTRTTYLSMRVLLTLVIMFSSVPHQNLPKKYIVSCSADCISFVTMNDISQIFILLVITR